MTYEILFVFCYTIETGRDKIILNLSVPNYLLLAKNITQAEIMVNSLSSIQSNKETNLKVLHNSEMVINKALLHCCTTLQYMLKLPGIYALKMRVLFLFCKVFTVGNNMTILPIINVKMSETREVVNQIY